MHGTNLATDWKVGSPITWSGEWKGTPYVDKGTVLEVEPGRRLAYTHWSPMGGSEDRPRTTTPSPTSWLGTVERPR